MLIVRSLNVDIWPVGVLFTRHPVTSDPGIMIINANYGLGEVSKKLKIHSENVCKTLQSFKCK